MAAAVYDIAQLRSLVGTEVATSGWETVTQERIRRFGEATGDLQWIHVEPERAARESPYGATVAHGFLTLALLPGLLAQALDVAGARMSVNYGLNRVRFTAPVPAGCRVRARFVLAGIEDIEGGAQLHWSVTLEREGQAKPVLVADWLTRRYLGPPPGRT